MEDNRDDSLDKKIEQDLQKLTGTLSGPSTKSSRTHEPQFIHEEYRAPWGGTLRLVLVLGVIVVFLLALLVLFQPFIPAYDNNVITPKHVNNATSGIEYEIEDLSVSHPYAIAAASDGLLYSYVANWSQNNNPGTISVIAMDSGTVLNSVKIGSDPTAIAVTPNNKYVYVTNWGSGTVSVISTSNYTVIGTINVGDFPFGIAATPNEKYIYVTGSKNVSVISTSDNKVVDSIKNASSPTAVPVVAPNGSDVYIAQGDGNISVISTSNNTLVHSIKIGNILQCGIIPQCIAISQSGKYIYALSPNPSTNSGSISVISVNNGTILSTINVGNSPGGMVVSPGGQYLYVTNESTNQSNFFGSISVISTSTDTIIGSIKKVIDPFEVAVVSSPDGQFLSTTARSEGNVSVNVVSVVAFNISSP